MIQHNNKKIIKLLLVFIIMIFLGSCSQNDNNNPSEDFNQTITLEGEVRTIHFEPLKEDIFFDGKKVGTSAETGTFEVSVSAKDSFSASAKLSLESNSLVFLDYNGSKITIIKLSNNESISDFYVLSGKVVLHSDGESVASGVVLRIDDHDVKSFDTNRNFDIFLVHKDSIVSVFKEDCEFIDVNMIPYNNICFSSMLDKEVETTTLAINGEEKQIKHLAGITFRLNDLK